MTEELWNSVDDYLTEVLVAPDDALNAALLSADKAGLPAINVSPPAGKLLYLMARAIGARNILEIGTLAGYSTIWLARALAPGGKLISLEADAKHADLARANIARAGLANVVDVRLGRALEILPQIAAEKREPFDFIFIDADKESIPDYFQWSLRLGQRGSLILVDNVIRRGRVIDAQCDDDAIRGVRKFNTMVAAEPRVTATAMQTVGCKGYDGFAVALITAD